MFRRTFTAKNPFSLGGKIGLITGAKEGIGRACALQMAKAGCSGLVLADVQDATGVIDEIHAAVGGKDKCKVNYFKCDVSNRDQVRDLFAETMKLHKRLDAAVNGAGIEGNIGTHLIENMDYDEFARVQSVNVNGVLYCLQEELKIMQAQGSGSIVNISSIAGVMGAMGMASYGASKHAVIGITKTAALENAQRGVRVNAVLPGPIVTPMLGRIMDSAPPMKALIENGVPMKRSGTPDEIANPVVFLLSDASSYMIGHTLIADGGFTVQ